MGSSQTWAQAVMLVMMVVVYGGGAWVIWKFYRAIARIGEELQEIKLILRNSRNLPTGETPPVNSSE